MTQHRKCFTSLRLALGGLALTGPELHQPYARMQLDWTTDTATPVPEAPLTLGGAVKRDALSVVGRVGVLFCFDKI